MTLPHSRARTPFRPRPLVAGLALALALPLGVPAIGHAAPPRDLPVRLSPTPAATVTVTSCADDGSPGTLRHAVAGAVSGDSIDLTQLQCSTITLANGAIPIVQSDLTLTGPGAANLAISGAGSSGVLDHRGTGTLSVHGLALVDGHTSTPGGCVHSAGKLDATAISVTGCTTAGGPYIKGGGLYVKGDVTLADSIISNNYGYQGGGIWTRGVLTLRSTTVAGNSAYMGGGIWTHGSSLSLTDSTISGNHAGFNSGGMLAYSEANPATGTASIVNSTISGNQSAEVNGAAYIANMALRMSNSTVALNKTGSGCAGLRLGGQRLASASMDSSLLAGNTSTLNGSPCDFQIQRVDVTGAHNLVVASTNQLPPDTIQLDPGLLPLADNGGPTQTHALGVGSPAIDQGSNPLGLGFDQRGQGHARVAGAAADIGAFEQQQTNSVPGVSKQFQPNTIRTNGLSTLTLSLVNIDSTDATLIGDLIDALPAPVILANPPNASTTCPDGSVIASPGSASLGLASGARIPASGSCTVTATVIAHAAGTFTNVIPAGALQTSAGASPDAATAVLTVNGQAIAPTVSKAFTPTAISTGQSALLIITLANSYPNAATLTAPLTDNLPTRLTIADPANAATTCPGGTLDAAPDGGAVTLHAGAQIPGGTCTISVRVTSKEAGSYLNRIPAGALVTDFGSNTDAAQAGLVVTPATADRIFFDGFDA